MEAVQSSAPKIEKYDPLINRQLVLVKAVFSLISLVDRKRFFRLLALAQIVAVVDVLGVASILPFISAISDPTGILIREVQSKVHFFEITGSGVVFLLGSGSLALLLMGLVAKASYVRGHSRYIALAEYEISRLLFQKMVHQSYIPLDKNRNYESVATEILSESSKVVADGISPFLNIFAYSIISLFLISFVGYVNYAVTGIAGVVIIGFYIGVVLFLKSLISSIGRARLESNTVRFDVVRDVEKSWREIVFFDLGQSYLDKFDSANGRYTKTISDLLVMLAWPKFFLEGIAFGGVIVILLFLNSTQSFQDAVAFTAVFAIAGYKLIPAAQTIYQGIINVKSCQASIERLSEQLGLLGPKTVDQIRNPILVGKREVFVSFQNVSFKYNDPDKFILKRCDFDIPSGSFSAFMGPSGVGKTTILDLILGLRKPDDGEVIYTSDQCGSSVGYLGCAGYVGQKMYLPGATIRDILRVGMREKSSLDDEWALSCLRTVCLDDIFDSFADVLDKNIGIDADKLSGGQRQRLGIARALVSKPALLILDESTAAVDEHLERQLLKNLKQLAWAPTILVVTHRSINKDLFDNVITVKNGKLAYQ